MNDVSEILSAIEQGDGDAIDRLFPVVYDELRALAQRQLNRERSDQTLQATALVHEAYLRLVGPRGAEAHWNSRGHFFSAAAEAMRRILIDRVRAKGALKRGGGRRKLRLDKAPLLNEEISADILDLEEALCRLVDEDARKAELVKLRFFAGLTMEEAADALGVSRATAARDWAYARAWLYNEILHMQHSTE